MKDKKLWDAFGFLWKFNVTQSTCSFNRWILLPTISAMCTESAYVGYAVRYWNLDLLWLKGIISIEIEQLDKERRHI